VRRQDTTFDGTRTDDIDIRSTGTGVLIGLGGGAILDTVIYSASSKDALGVAAAIGDPSALSASVRGVVRSMDASVPVYDLEPLTNTLDRATARTRFVLTILAAVAAITLLLGAIGRYGMIAYIVTLRTREFGLRLALGARPRDVLGLVLRDGVTLSVIGVRVGLAAFAGVARCLKAFLFQVSVADPYTLSVVVITLIAVAGVASALPAWRASRIDPLDALRAE
jgi:putative ABC transport system permease protein